jgi:hypothetical protein
MLWCHLTTVNEATPLRSEASIERLWTPGVAGHSVVRVLAVGSYDMVDVMGVEVGKVLVGNG